MEKSNEKNLFIRIEEITLRLDDDESLIEEKIAKILGLDVSDIISWSPVKRAIDSRHKNNILFVYSVDVKIKNQSTYFAHPEKFSELLNARIIRHKVIQHEPYVYQFESVAPTPGRARPLVVGSGPSGLFAALLLAKSGLKPLMIERGRDIDSRIKDVNHFFSKGELNPKSNIQFGEGGAGTFSDGKLYTLVNDPRKKYIFETLVQAGAPAEITIDAHPHIGTDKIRQAVKSIRQEIIRLGGEVRFESCLTDLEIESGEIKAVIINGQEKVLVNELIIAIGHSARDTYEMLYKKGVAMTAKPFSIGVRIEHDAETMKRAQYGSFCKHPKLPAARYALVGHLSGGRSVYTFCMCPGGYVIAAASEAGGVVTNGMSEYARDGQNSNSALLVNVSPEDFGSDHPLAGIEFQREWERKAFILGGSNYQAPAQLVGDFLNNRASTKIRSIQPSYRPGVTLTSLDNCLPAYVATSLREAIPALDKKIAGFSNPDAVLTGVETRSSSPVRIVRDEFFQSNIRGIYPIGEGAGYAGGIVSSAIDGLKAAEFIIKAIKSGIGKGSD